MNQLSIPILFLPHFEVNVILSLKVSVGGRALVQPALDISDLLLGISLKCLKPLAFDSKFK